MSEHRMSLAYSDRGGGDGRSSVGSRSEVGLKKKLSLLSLGLAFNLPHADDASSNGTSSFSSHSLISDDEDEKGGGGGGGAGGGGGVELVDSEGDSDKDDDDDERARRARARGRASVARRSMREERKGKAEDEEEADEAADGPRGPCVGLLTSLAYAVGRKDLETDEYSWFETVLNSIRNHSLALRLARQDEETEVELTHKYIETINQIEATKKAPYTMDVRLPHLEADEADDVEDDGVGGADDTPSLGGDGTDESSDVAAAAAAAADKVERSRRERRDDALEYPLLADTRDAYQFLTWKWLEKRVHIESESISASEERGVYATLLQTTVCVALCAFAIGRESNFDEQIMYYVTAGCVGVAGVVSGVYGFVGFMRRSRSALLRFRGTLMFLIPFVIAHFLIAGDHLRTQQLQCSASVENDAVDSGSCTGVFVSRSVSIFLASVSLLASVYTPRLPSTPHFPSPHAQANTRKHLRKQLVGMHSGMDVADSLTDKDAIMEEVRMFKYFQRKLDGTPPPPPHNFLPPHTPTSHPSAVFEVSSLTRLRHTELDMQMKSLDTFEMPPRVLAADGDIDWLDEEDGEEEEAQEELPPELAQLKSPLGSPGAAQRKTKFGE